MAYAPDIASTILDEGVGGIHAGPADPRAANRHVRAGNEALAKIKRAQGIAYLIGALTLIAAIVTGFVQDDWAIAGGMAAEAGLFLACGYFATRHPRAALGAALGLYVLDFVVVLGTAPPGAVAIVVKLAFASMLLVGLRATWQLDESRAALRKLGVGEQRLAAWRRLEDVGVFAL